MSSGTRTGFGFISNPFATLIAGAAVGFWICWFTMVRPLVGHLDQRENAVREWERINRQEREAIAGIKTISTEELRKWVSTLDEQNLRYMELQNTLHHQEIALIAPPTIHLWIAFLAVVSVAGLAVWMIRDSNADDARTLHGVLAILPSLREGLKERRETLEVSGPECAKLDSYTANCNSVSLPKRVSGKINRFVQDKSFGFITPNGGGKDLFFHTSSVRLARSQMISEGVPVSYRVSKDPKGRPCAADVEITG